MPTMAKDDSVDERGRLISKESENECEKSKEQASSAIHGKRKGGGRYYQRLSTASSEERDGNEALEIAEGHGTSSDVARSSTEDKRDGVMTNGQNAPKRRPTGNAHISAEINEASSQSTLASKSESGARHRSEAIQRRDSESPRNSRQSSLDSAARSVRSRGQDSASDRCSNEGHRSQRHHPQQQQQPQKVVYYQNRFIAVHPAASIDRKGPTTRSVKTASTGARAANSSAGARTDEYGDADDPGKGRGIPTAVLAGDSTGREDSQTQQHQQQTGQHGGASENHTGAGVDGCPAKPTAQRNPNHPPLRIGASLLDGPALGGEGDGPRHWHKEGGDNNGNGSQRRHAGNGDGGKTKDNVRETSNRQRHNVDATPLDASDGEKDRNPGPDTGVPLGEPGVIGHARNVPNEQPRDSEANRTDALGRPETATRATQDKTMQPIPGTSSMGDPIGPMGSLSAIPGVMNMGPAPGRTKAVPQRKKPTIFDQIKRTLQDNRVRQGDKEAELKLKSINSVHGDSNVILKKILNITFLTIGLSLLTGVVVVILYTSIWYEVHEETTDCPEFHSLPEALEAVSTCNRHLDAVCAFVCQEDYELIGQAQVTCLNESRWSGALPTCVYIGPFDPPVTEYSGSHVKDLDDVELENTVLKSKSPYDFDSEVDQWERVDNNEDGASIRESKIVKNGRRKNDRVEFSESDEQNTDATGPLFVPAHRDNDWED